MKSAKLPILRFSVAFAHHLPSTVISLENLRNFDSARLKQLLELLTLNANFDADSRDVIRVDPATTILCATDEFCPNIGVIGTISVHFWSRIRPGSALCAYFHDLVILPEYRRLGIASQLLDKAIELCER